MKTKQKSVIVVVSEDGIIRRRIYPIATRSGELMTRRLKRILAGNISANGAERSSDIHFVEVEWHEPYSILNELRDDCSRLIDEIVAVTGVVDLSDFSGPTRRKPFRNNNERISFLIDSQLKLRRRLQKMLHEARDDH